MHFQTMDILRSLLAFLVGGGIGVAFAAVQNLALRRNEKKQASGELNNGWAVMPGSTKRVAWLLVALVLIQIICPILFVDGSQWYVSAGVVLGYGAVLFRRFRRRPNGAG